jgi:hypothetical protein
MRLTYLLLLGMLSSGAAAAPEFSADIVSRTASGMDLRASARLFVANGKVRIETAAAAAGYFLVDGTAAIFVHPERQIFTDARQSTPLTRIFLAVDPANPCPQWQAAAQNAGDNGEWSCERITTREYNVAASRRWIDAHLQFPVRFRAADGTTLTLEHIRVGTQPAGLFTVPASYRKSDPHALIERLKQSDVWVEPPK